MCIPFHLLKTYIMKSSLLFISFSPSHLSRNHDVERKPHT
jgi:hypothetical protein